MNRLLAILAVAMIGCSAISAQDAPPKVKELYRLEGPAGNSFVLRQTSLGDPSALSGLWPQKRLQEIESVYAIAVLATQKGKPDIAIGGYIRLASAKYGPEMGIEVLAAMLEPHYLWFVIRERSEVVVRRFTVDGGVSELFGLGSWETNTVPAARHNGTAIAAIRRDGAAVVVHVEDRERAPTITRSHFILRTGDTKFSRGEE